MEITVSEIDFLVTPLVLYCGHSLFIGSISYQLLIITNIE